MIRHVALIGFLAVGLVLVLAATFLADSAHPVASSTPPVATPMAPTPLPLPTADYRQAVVEIGYSRTNGRFGLRSTTGDPASRTDDSKRLTYASNGETNNTRVWIDGETPIFGSTGLLGLGGGHFVETPHLDNGHFRSIWTTKDVEVTQDLTYVYGTNTRRADTVQIKYALINRGNVTRQVGLRIMLDTLIGNNDGVPFVVPGRSGITSQAVDLRGAGVPDFIQALENPNLAAPGVIVHLTLRGADATPPDRVVISAWCSDDAAWDYYASLGGDRHPLTRCGPNTRVPDSAIGLYFDPQPLAPNQNRVIVTYYGLGGISSTETGNVSLSLTFSRIVRQGDTFWVTALAAKPQTGQTVKLDLPAGLALASGYRAEQSVTPGGDYTQVSWQVIAEAPLNNGAVTVTLQPAGIKESQSITVQPKGITR